MGFWEDWREIIEKGRKAWPEIKEGIRKIVEGAPEVYERSSSEQSFIKAYAQAVLDGLKPNQPYIAVGMAEEFLLEALQLSAPTEIRLSAQTIESHRHHEDVTADIYAAIIPLIIFYGIWIKRQKDGRVSAYLQLENDGDIWEMGIKRTKKPSFISRLYIAASRGGCKKCCNTILS